MDTGRWRGETEGGRDRAIEGDLGGRFVEEEGTGDFSAFRAACFCFFFCFVFET